MHTIPGWTAHSLPPCRLPVGKRHLAPATRSPTTSHARTAQAMDIDLSRRSTPAEGGFCTFQPVVDGGACPWHPDCHDCDMFVLSGGDLLYWRRKREQWRLLAEGAPDDATADYLHQYFEPTARAIDGLERALADRFQDRPRRRPRNPDRRLNGALNQLGRVLMAAHRPAGEPPSPR
ncbi:hypothetical protein ACWDZ6_30550 [Streptomyces sp. NPDC002926]